MEWLLILAALALIAVCAASSSQQNSRSSPWTGRRWNVPLTTVTAPRRRHARVAHALDAALRRADRITLTNLAIGFLAEPAIAGLIDDPLASLGLGDRAATGVADRHRAVPLDRAHDGVRRAGPQEPRDRAPVEVVRALQGFQRGFTRAVGWPIHFYNGSANWILRRMGLEPQEELASARSPQELASLVNRSAEQGTLEEDTARLVTRTIAFGDRRADDAMTPRAECTRSSRRSRRTPSTAWRARRGTRAFRSCRRASTRSSGSCTSSTWWEVDPERRDWVTVGDIMVDPVVVPSSLELDPLLGLLRDGRLQMAVVVDEFGEVDGVVTMEDLIEELVGDVVDEHDNHRGVLAAGSGGHLDALGAAAPRRGIGDRRRHAARGRGVRDPRGLLTLHLEHIAEEGDSAELIVERFEQPDVARDAHRGRDARPARRQDPRGPRGSPTTTTATTQPVGRTSDERSDADRTHGPAAARQRVLRRRRVRTHLRAPHGDRTARARRLASGAHDAARDGARCR